MTDETVSIKLDLRSGALEVTAPDVALERVFAQVSAILPTLQSAVVGDDAPVAVGEVHTDGATGDGKESSPNRQRPAPRRRTKSRRSTNGDSNNSSRIGTPFYKDFSPIDLGISDTQEIEIAEFYKTKSPKTTKEKALVASYIAHKILNRDHFNYDDLYQILRTSGENSPPGNMSSAVGNLLDDNFVAKEESGLRIKIQGIDEVEKKMNINGNSE